MRSLSFILKDLTRRSGVFAVMIVGIAVAVTGVFILFSLRLGIEQTLFESRGGKNALAQLMVYGKGSSVLKLIGSSVEKPLNDGTIEEIQNIPDVASVSPHMVYGNIASVVVSIFGQTLTSDALIFGMPAAVVAGDIEPGAAWDDAENNAHAGNEESAPAPVLVSRKLLDFYNLSLAPGGGLPPLSEKIFIGQEIKIMPGVSSFFSNGAAAERDRVSLAGRIVGFSNQVDLIGITLPLDTVRRLNAAEGIARDAYNKLFVTVANPRAVAAVSAEIEGKGYRVTSVQKEFEEVGRSLGYIAIILYIVSGIIVTTGVLLIATSFWFSLERRQKELGIMRAIGATRMRLTSLLLCEAGIIGLLGSFLGIAMGSGMIFLLREIIKKNFTLSSLQVEHLFFYSPALLLILAGIGAVLSVCASYIPTAKMLSVTPRTLFSK